MSTQLSLPCLVKKDAPTHPKLDSYELIVLSTSAGKDSLAMMSHVCALARTHGVGSRVHAIHADLGQVEWPGVEALVHEQARHFDLELHVVSRIGQRAQRSSSLYEEGESYGDLLDYAERRGAWPDPTRRWCTSEFKRGPIERAFTQMARDYLRAHPHHTGPVRILDCIGLRAEESAARAKRKPFVNRKHTRTQHVDTWLPIHDWSTSQVWEAIHASGAPSHPAYEQGMSRLSCIFCIMASEHDLGVAAARHPELLERYVALEQKLGHTFQHKKSLSRFLPKPTQASPNPTDAR